MHSPAIHYVRTKLFSIRWLYKSLQLADYPDLINIAQTIPLPPKPESQSFMISDDIADQLLFYSHINNTYKEPVSSKVTTFWSVERGNRIPHHLRCKLGWVVNFGDLFWVYGYSIKIS